MSEHVRVEKERGVLSLTFARPERRNAITVAMYAALADAVEKAQTDPDLRVITISGEGEDFTAGNDLADFLQALPREGEEIAVWRLLRALAVNELPLIAAVHGNAIGIGTTMLLHCDLVYAGDDARFSMPFTQLGVVPEFASSYLLPLIAGYQRAAELLLLGEPFDANTALAAGFVTRVVPAAQALETAWAAAEKLARLPARPVQLTRALLKSAHREAIERQLRTEGTQFRALLREPAAREALAAFLEKRKPDWSKV